MLHALKTLAWHALVKLAVIAAVHLAALANAQTLVGYEATTGTLHKIDVQTGGAIPLGQPLALPAGHAIVALDTVGARLFAIMLGGPAASLQSRLIEIKPCSGMVMAQHDITNDGQPLTGYVESLAHTADGTLIAAYSTSQQGVSSSLGTLTTTGTLTPLSTFTSALDDFDGLTAAITDAGDDNASTYDGFFALNRDQDTSTNHLLRITDGATTTTTLRSIPFTPAIDGLNDLAMISGVLYGADFTSRRLYSFDPTSGDTLSHKDLAPALAFSAIAPFKPIHFATQPISATGCITTDVHYSFATGGPGPFAYQWQVESPLHAWHDITTTPTAIPGGGVVSADTPTAPEASIRLRGRTGRLRVRCIVTGPCATAATNPCNLSINSADFNNDGAHGQDDDIEAFFLCLGGHCEPTWCSSDFNGDGAAGQDSDIESFFLVLGGGNC